MVKRAETRRRSRRPIADEPDDDVDLEEEVDQSRRTPAQRARSESDRGSAEMVRKMYPPRRQAVAEEPEDYDDVHELEAALRIDEDGLDEALTEQPELFYRVSKAYAIEASRRDAAKQAVQDAEAEADVDARADVADQGKKTTETEIKALVQTDKRVVAARRRFAELAESTAKLAALKEAYQQRSYALKDLAGLYVANYYTASEHTNARRTINEERRRRG